MTRAELYLSYANYDKGEIVVFQYNHPAYRDWHAVLYQPRTKRWYPITNMGLQAHAWDEIYGL